MQFKQIWIIMTITIIMIFFVNDALGGSLSLITISALPNIVKQLANYTILITPIITTIPTNGYISIIFPSTYTLVSGVKTCQSIGTKISTPVCTAYSTNNTIVISNFGGSASSNLQITIQGIYNPNTDSKSSPFQLITQNNAGAELDSNNNINNWQILPDTLTGVTLSPTNPTAGNLGSFIVTFTPTNPIPQGGYISINIPTYNGASGATGTSIRPMIVSSNPICLGTSGIDNSLICTFNFSTNVLTISNGFIQKTSYQSQINFTVQSFQNPFSISPKTGFIISTGYNDGNIDQSGSLSITITQPATIVSARLFSSPTTINSISAYTFSIVTALYVEVGSTLQLIFPTGFTTSNVATVLRKAPTYKTLSFNPATSSITISNIVDSYSDAPLNFAFEVDSVKNPGTTQQSSAFSIYIYDSNGNISQRIITPTTLTITATPGTLTILNIIPSSLKLKDITTYNFTITLSNSLTSNAALSIAFPSIAKIQNGIQKCLSNNIHLAFLNTQADCIVTSNSNIQIDNLLSTNYSPNNEIIQIIISSVTNPTSLEPLTFDMQTTDNGYTIDNVTSNQMMATLNPDPIIQYNTNQILTYTANFTYDMGIYNFLFLTTNPIPTGGSLLITFPDSMKVLSSSICSNFRGFINTPTCVINAASNQISISTTTSDPTIPLGLSISHIRNPRSNITSSSITIQTLTSKSYLIDQIITGLTVTSAAISNFLSTTNVLPSSYVNGAINTYTFKLAPFALPINSDYFIIKLPIEINLSSNTKCQGDSSIITSFNLCSPDTTQNKIKIQPNYIQGLNDGLIFNLYLTNIQNQQASYTSNSIDIEHYDQYNGLIELMENGLTITTTQSASFINVTTNPISYLISTSTSYTFIIQNSLNIPSQSIIKITLSQDFGLLNLKLDTHSTNLGNPILSFGSNFISLSNISSISSNNAMTFTIENIMNPASLGKAYNMIINTYTKSNQIIESKQASNLIFTCIQSCMVCAIQPTNCSVCNQNTPYLYTSSCYATCPDGTVASDSYTCIPCTSASNCKTCSKFNISECTICGTNYPYLSVVDNRCYNTCPIGQYYLSGTTTCKKCDQNSNCATCNPNDNTECLTCPQSYSYLNQIDSKCYATCPSGTIPTTSSSSNNNQKICIACDSSSNCNRCQTDDLSLCTSCTSNIPYLSGIDNKCYSNCPMNTLVIQTNDPITGLSSLYCKACTSPSTCLTCDANDLSKCLTCPIDQPYMNINTTECYTQCPSGTTLSGNFCVLCSPSCKECALGLPNNCTTCPSSNPIFSNADNKCYSQCPGGTYLDESANTCNSCNSTCSTCKGNANSCTLCMDGLYLYDTECLTKCPEGLTTVNTTCYSRDCSIGCALCANNASCSQCKTNYELKNDGTCSYSGRITVATAGFPFPFLLLSLLTIIILLFIEYYHGENLFFNNMMATLNVWQFLAWIVLMILFFVEGFVGSGVICILGLVANWALNAGFYYFYRKKVIEADVIYHEWREGSLKYVKYIEITSYATSLQFLRIVFGRILSKQWSIASFKDDQIPKRIFNYFGLSTIIVKDFPIILANYLSFSSINTDSQLFFSAVETFILATISAGLAILSYTLFSNEVFRKYVNDEPVIVAPENKGFERIIDDTAINDSKSYSHIIQITGNEHKTIARGKGAAKGIVEASPDAASEVYGLFSGEKFMINPKKTVNKEVINKILNDLTDLKKEESIIRGGPSKLIGENEFTPSTVTPITKNRLKRRLSFTHGSKIRYDTEPGHNIFQDKREDLEAYLRMVKDGKSLLCSEVSYVEEQILKTKSARKPYNMNNLLDFNMSLNNGLSANEEYEFFYEMDNQLSPNKKLKSISQTKNPGTIFEESDLETAGDQITNTEQSKSNITNNPKANNNGIVNSNVQGNNTKSETNSPNTRKNYQKESRRDANNNNNTNNNAQSNAQFNTQSNNAQNNENILGDSMMNSTTYPFHHHQNETIDKTYSEAKSTKSAKSRKEERSVQIEMNNEEELYDEQKSKHSNVSPKTKEMNNSRLTQSQKKKSHVNSVSPNRGVNRPFPGTARVNKENGGGGVNDGKGIYTLVNNNTNTNNNNNRSLSQRTRRHMFENYNDDVERLMKITVINNDYKKDLFTNQVIKKSNYGYDQAQRNPNVQTELKKLQNDHLEEILEINARSIRGIGVPSHNPLGHTHDSLLNNSYAIDADESLFVKVNNNSASKGQGVATGTADTGFSKELISQNLNSSMNKAPGYDSFIRDIENNDVIYLDNRKDEDVILEVGKIVVNDPKFTRPNSRKNENDRLSGFSGLNNEIMRKSRPESIEKRNSMTPNERGRRINEKKFESPRQYKLIFPNQNLIQQQQQHSNTLNISDI